MATLLDLALASPSNVKQGIVQTIVERAPVLNYLNFENAESLRYEWVREDKLPQGKFRGYGEAYTEDEGKFNLEQLQLKPFGSRFVADRKMKKVQTFDLQSWAAKQLEMHSRAIGLDFKDMLVNGDVSTDPKAFDGLKRIVPSSQNIAFNGGTGQLQADPTVTLDYMGKALDACYTAPSVILCSKAHIQAIDAITTRDSAVNRHFTIEYITIGNIRLRVGMWDGIVMLPLEENSQGQQVIDFNETGNTSSMFFVSSGAGLFSVVGDMDSPEVTTYETANGTEFVLDWALGLALEHPRAITRLSGILA